MRLKGRTNHGPGITKQRRERLPRGEKLVISSSVNNLAELIVNHSTIVPYADISLKREIPETYLGWM